MRFLILSGAVPQGSGRKSPNKIKMKVEVSTTAIEA